MYLPPLHPELPYVELVEQSRSYYSLKGTIVLSPTVRTYQDSVVSVAEKAQLAPHDLWSLTAVTIYPF